MKTGIASLTCACALLLACNLATAADGPDAPPARTITKARPGSAHPKASSFAPHRHSNRHVYGAPVSAPILHNRKPVPKPATPPAK